MEIKSNDKLLSFKIRTFNFLHTMHYKLIIFENHTKSTSLDITPEQARQILGVTDYTPEPVSYTHLDVYKRQPIILGEYSEPEFEVLKDLKWEATEKIDGTNMSCCFHPGFRMIEVRGKTENASIPTHLHKRMEELFQFDLLYKAFGVQTETGETVYPEKVEIFGEGYGLKIQKGGNYIKDHCDFILFDVRILTSTGESLWLTREACEDIAKKLNLKIVPLVGYMTIKEAEDFVKAGFKSLIAENKDYIAEGLVLKAPCGLLNRRGKRIITKIKYCDYKDL